MFRKGENILKAIWLGILLSLIFMACSKEPSPCYQPTETSLKLAFVARNLHRIDSITPDGNLIDTMIIQYQDTFLNNSRIYTYDLPQNYGVQNMGNATRIDIPLNPAFDKINYVFQMDTSIAILDTIQVQYNANRKFVSNACGFSFEYEISNIELSNHSIDSFILRKPKVDLENENNIQLYFY